MLSFHNVCQHDRVDRYGISVTNDHRYVPLVINTYRCFPHARLITGFVTRFSGVHVARPLGLCVCFIDRCLFFWSLCCLFFFDIRILITPLVSLNSSCKSSDCTNIKWFHNIWYPRVAN